MQQMFFVFLGISVADLSSEDLELTQRLCESLLVSDAQINPEGEEVAVNACSRLRHTVDTLLELLNQANTQVVDVFHFLMPPNVFQQCTKEPPGKDILF